ncbi:hypothetical protein Cpir12675_000652 [Ceratocystis pirilliformis]|uniref:N-acetyltransferase domain-containing protein n=1 Tax=Ceratocystis pirilliformis TaxID=259994 RepID=A0ABR3ZKB3_9PEZI
MLLTTTTAKQSLDFFSAKNIVSKMPSFFRNGLSIASNRKANRGATSSYVSSSSSSVASESISCKTTLVPRNRESLRVLSRKEYKEVALALSHAFANDELSRYMVDAPDMKNPSEEALWKLHVDMMTYISSYYFFTGQVVSIGPDYESIAMWVRPGEHEDGWWTVMRSGLWKLKFQLSREGKRRYYKEIVPSLDRLKKSIMGERDNDCYYLIYLGTKPSGRRKGYASRLLRDMIQQADREGKPMYLESSSPSNTQYYRKFGFECKEDIWFGEDRSVLLTAMVREPQNNAISSSHSGSDTASVSTNDST